MNLSGEEIKTILFSTKDLFVNLPQTVYINDGKIILEKSQGESGQWLKYPREKLYEMSWPVNPGTYAIKDPACPVAVICPRQDSELQEQALNYGAGISGPCITPDRGVELVISNIISNPNIRFVILAGQDSGHLAGDVLYCVNRFGIDDKTKRVINTKCPTNPYIRNLPIEAVKRFQEQVKVINLLGTRNVEELALMIRCCMQEMENPVKFTDTLNNETLMLCDKGSENREPLVFKFGTERKGGYFEGFDRTGTSIHSLTVSESYPLLESHILANGSFGMQESSRLALDTVGTQITIHDVSRDLIPDGWKPHGWMQTPEDVKNYVEKYCTWVYLFPLSDAKFEAQENVVVPYVPEKMEYAYGTRLVAYGYETAPEEEKQQIRKLVESMHEKFRLKTPTFDDVINFYEELAKVQVKTFNQLYAIAKALRSSIANNFGASYRMYMSLQIPPIDIKEDPRQAHAPCFAMFNVFPRKISGKWQLDCSLYLQRHDFLAYPANANAGILLQKFLGWFGNIQPGKYLHHAGCVHICDYMLPKEILDKYRDKN